MDPLKSKTQAIIELRTLAPTFDIKTAKLFVERCMDLGVRDHEADKVVRETLAGLEKKKE